MPFFGQQYGSAAEVDVLSTRAGPDLTSVAVCDSIPHAAFGAGARGEGTPVSFTRTV